MMARKTHHLKITSNHFIDVIVGEKTAEVRKNDRDFKNGDYLILKEYDKGIYSGSECVVMVTHTLHGGQYGIEKGFVVLSFIIDYSLSVGLCHGISKAEEKSKK